MSLQAVATEERSLSDPDKLHLLNLRMNKLCPSSASRDDGASLGFAGKGRRPHTSTSEDTTSVLSESEASRRSFGVVIHNENSNQSKRRRLDAQPQDVSQHGMQSPRRVTPTKLEQAALVQRPPEPAQAAAPPRAPSRKRPALQDYHLNPCTSKDVPKEQEEAAGAAAATASAKAGPQADAEASRAKALLRGQKNIGDFFHRNRTPAADGPSPETPARGDAFGAAAAAMRAHPGSAEPAAMAAGQDAQTPGRPGTQAGCPPLQAAAAAGAPAQSAQQAAQLRALLHDLDSLRAENARLQAALDAEKAAHARASHDAQRHRAEAAAATRRQDELEGKLEGEMQRFSSMVKERMAATARIVKQLSRKEAELQNLRIQTNNQLLGVLVRKDGAAMADLATEYFEPGFAFHQLHSRLTDVEVQKLAVDARRKELKSASRQANASGAADAHLLSSNSYQEEMLKSKYDSLLREEKAILADRARIVIEQTLHIKDVKLKRDFDASVYKDHRILAERYVLMSMFGKGGFAEVYRAYDLHEMKEVALKIHTVDCKMAAEQREYVRRAIREVTIQEALQHPRIVQMHHVFQINDNSFAIVMAACRGGDLQSYLSQRPNKQLPEKEAKTIIAQVFEGLAYLNTDHLVEGRGGGPSTNHIIHYDLKPANILFDDYGTIKISDFGLSKLLDVGNGHSMELTSPGAGTLYYQPPECQMRGPEGRNPQISNKVDVWAAGVIFYEMLYGKRPFHANVSQQSIASGSLLLGASELSFDAKPTVSAEAKDFIRKCLTYNHRNRPDVLAAASDPYLRLGKEKGRRNSSGGVHAHAVAAAPPALATWEPPGQDAAGDGAHVRELAAAAAAAAASGLPSAHASTFMP